jgi:hypothetical protein
MTFSNLRSLVREFYDESEETSDLIEERLAKTINTSLRANISESKFKETKSVITEQFLSNTIVCMCNVIETFLHDWFEIIFIVLIKEGAHCRQHSQTI